MRFKKIAAFVLAAIMAGSLAACNTNSESNSAVDSGSAAQAGGGESNADDDKEVVLRLAENWDFSLGIVPSLNPSVASNYGSIYWGRNFYDTLVAYDKNGEIVGQLAESWEVSDDGKDYTFKLRDGVKFSDGTDLTADAVKLSFEAAIENLGMYNGSYGMLSKLISETEVVDGKTVVLHLTQPYYGTLNDLTMSCPLAIINPAAFDGQEDLMYGESFKNASFGTGAYMYAGDNANGVYTFVRNPYYWGEAPEVDSFTVTAIEDNDAKLLALKSGEIDAIINTSHVSFDGFAEIAANPEFNTAMDEDVSFAYGEKNVLENINFSLEKNKMLALVGPSGGGKSTIASLLTRFWDVKSGQILIRGKDIRDVPLAELMKQVSVVFQRVYLFQDTIFNNISMGKPDASRDEVISAAKKAQCYDFIMALPNGFETVVGEGGATLSGGEKQRISIARCILKDSPIIILDEATASVDADNESKIQQAISELCNGKTLIIIAHRLGTIRNADKILVISGGGIVQSGNHDELVAQKGIYRDFITVREKSRGWSGRLSS